MIVNLFFRVNPATGNLLLSGGMWAHVGSVMQYKCRSIVFIDVDAILSHIRQQARKSNTRESIPVGIRALLTAQVQPFVLLPAHASIHVSVPSFLLCIWSICVQMHHCDRECLCM